MEILPVTTSEAGLLSTSISFWKQRTCLLDGHSRNSSHSNHGINILKNPIYSLIPSCLGSIRISLRRWEIGQVSKWYIPESREKWERNLPWFRQNQNSATSSFLQHHMLFLCSIKTGSQVRKRGRRQWWSVLEKQPGLATSRDQVLKQMGSDSLAALLCPHVHSRSWEWTTLRHSLLTSSQ